MTRRLVVVVLVMIALITSGASAASLTTITWHGHAAFEIGTPNGVVILIDPWLTNPVNLAAKENKDPLEQVKKVDYILITHGHFDHVGDAVAIAKKTGARLVTNFELGTNMAKLLGYPKDQMGFDTLMNIGGHFGMEPEMAARAAASVRVRLAIPMHFGTFPVLTQDAAVFRQALKKQGVPFRQLHPGETIAFEGKRIKPTGK